MAAVAFTRCLSTPPSTWKSSPMKTEIHGRCQVLEKQARMKESFHEEIRRLSLETEKQRIIVEKLTKKCLQASLPIDDVHGDPLPPFDVVRFTFSPTISSESTPPHVSSDFHPLLLFLDIFPHCHLSIYVASFEC